MVVSQNLFFPASCSQPPLTGYMWRHENINTRRNDSFSGSSCHNEVKILFFLAWCSQVSTSPEPWPATCDVIRILTPKGMIYLTREGADAVCQDEIKISRVHKFKKLENKMTVSKSNWGKPWLTSSYWLVLRKKGATEKYVNLSTQTEGVWTSKEEDWVKLICCSCRCFSSFSFWSLFISRLSAPGKPRPPLFYWRDPSRISTKLFWLTLIKLSYCVWWKLKKQWH
jgi:hypothetical protein